MLKKAIALFAMAALLLAVTPTEVFADTIGGSYTAVIIDGQKIPMDDEAKGNGWSYNGRKSNTVLLNNYNGGPIMLIRGTSGDYNAKQLRIETVNGSTNTINGNGEEAAIGVQGTLRFNLGYGSTLNIKGDVTKGAIIAGPDKRYGNEMIDMETFNRVDLMDEEHQAEANANGQNSFENEATLNIDVKGDNIVGMGAGQRIFCRSNIKLNINLTAATEKGENAVFNAPQIEIKHNGTESSYTVNGTYGMIFGELVQQPAVKDYHRGTIKIKAPSVFGTKATKEKWAMLFADGKKQGEGEVRNAPADFAIVDGNGETDLKEDLAPYVGPAGGTTPDPGPTPDPAPNPNPTPNPDPAPTPDPTPVAPQKLVLTMNQLKASLNGKALKVDAAPFVVDGRTMVPLRLVAESFGCEVNWLGNERKVEVKTEDKILYFFIDNKEYTEISLKDGVPTKHTMTVAPFIQKGTNRTFIPVRYVGNALGYKADYTKDAQGLTADVIFER